MKYVKVFLVVLVLDLLAGLVAYHFSPGLRDQLTKENRFVEDASALAFFGTFVIGAVSWPRAKGKNGFGMLVFLAILGLVGFLDEISFGERLFGFSMPVVHGVKIDAVHDFLTLGFTVAVDFARADRSLAVVVAGVACAAAVTVVLGYRAWLRRFFSSSMHYPPYILLTFSATLIFVALVIDLQLWPRRVLFMFEELFEMNAGLALLFAVLYVRRQALNER